MRRAGPSPGGSRARPWPVSLLCVCALGLVLFTGASSAEGTEGEGRLPYCCADEKSCNVCCDGSENPCKTYSNIITEGPDPAIAPGIKHIFYLLSPGNYTETQLQHLLPDTHCASTQTEARASVTISRNGTEGHVTFTCRQKRSYPMCQINCFRGITFNGCDLKFDHLVFDAVDQTNPILENVTIENGYLSFRRLESLQPETKSSRATTTAPTPKQLHIDIVGLHISNVDREPPLDLSVDLGNDLRFAAFSFVPNSSVPLNLTLRNTSFDNNTVAPLIISSVNDNGGGRRIGMTASTASSMAKITVEFDDVHFRDNNVDCQLSMNPASGGSRKKIDAAVAMLSFLPSQLVDFDYSGGSFQCNSATNVTAKIGSISNLLVRTTSTTAEPQVTASISGVQFGPSSLGATWFEHIGSVQIGRTGNESNVFVTGISNNSTEHGIALHAVGCSFITLTYVELDHNGANTGNESIAEAPVLIENQGISSGLTMTNCTFTNNSANILKSLRDSSSPLVLEALTISGTFISLGDVLPYISVPVLVQIESTNPVKLLNVTFTNNRGVPLRLVSVPKAEITDLTISDTRVATTKNATGPISAGVVAINSVFSIQSSKFMNNIVTDWNGIGALGACLRVTFDHDEEGHGRNDVEVLGTLFQGCEIRHGDPSRRIPTQDVWQDRFYYAGGAIHVLFGRLDSRMFKVVNSNFTNNWAFRGAAIAVLFNESASGNQFIIEGPGTFDDNTATGLARGADLHSPQNTEGAGGAVSVIYNSTDTSNSFELRGYTFEGNSAAEGGGLHALFYGQLTSHDFVVSNCVFERNKALVGSAIRLLAGNVWARYLTSTASTGGGYGVTLDGLDVYDNVAYTCGAISITGMEAKLNGSMNFTRNSNSAICLYDSYLNFATAAHFTDNYAHAGGAIYSIISRIQVTSDSSAHFQNNMAVTTGGAIFAFVEVHSSQASPLLDCFLEHSEDVSEGSRWNDFRDNFAGVAGSAIYVNHLGSCMGHAMDALIAKLDGGGNRIIDQLYNDYRTLMANQATPGGSLCELMQPRGLAWDPNLIVNRSASYYNNSSEGIWSDRTAATDITAVYVLPPDSSLLKFNESLICSQTDLLKKASQVEVEVDFIGAGLSNKLTVLCCDHMKNAREALLYLMVEHGTGSGIGDAEDRFDMNVSISARTVQLTVEKNVGGYKAYTDPVAFSAKLNNASNGTIRKNVSIQVVGTSYSIKTRFRVKLQRNCPAGYIFDTDRSECRCDTDNPYIRDCDGCNVTVVHGYYLYTDPTSGNYQHTLCPAGFCKCPNETCSINVNNQSTMDQDQCNENRHGILCNDCPEGKVSVMDVFGGRCDECDSKFHRHYSWLVVILVAIVLDGTVLFLNVPLSNDIKGLLFYHSVVFMLPYQSDILTNKIASSATDKGWQPANLLLAIASMNSPTACFFHVESMEDSIAYRYIGPALVLFFLIPMHIFAHYWMRHVSDYLPIFDGTWLLLYFPFIHTLETTMRLLASVTLDQDGSHLYFLYNAHLRYFEGTHLRYAAVAVAFAVVLAAFIFCVAWLCADKPVPKCIRTTGEGARVALQVGLHKGWKRQWWTWDLIRRVIIVAIYMSANYNEWIKHVLIQVAILGFLLFHIWAKPYMAIHKGDEEVQPTLVGVLPCLRGRHGCNYLEAAVLVNMLLVCRVSTSAVEPTAQSEARRGILAFLILWPTLLFYVMLIYKVICLIKRRVQNKRMPHPAQEALLSGAGSGLNGGHGTRHLQGTYGSVDGASGARSTRRSRHFNPSVLEDTDELRPSSPPVSNNHESARLLP